MYVYDRQSYFREYGTHPLASYYITEYKTVSEAEYQLFNYNSKNLNKNVFGSLVKKIAFYIMDWYDNLFYDEQKAMEKYLSQATDLTDLEIRQRNWDLQKRQNNNTLKLQYS